MRAFHPDFPYEEQDDEKKNKSEGTSVENAIDLMILEQR